jgi:hypothetical protein
VECVGACVLAAQRSAEWHCIVIGESEEVRCCSLCALCSSGASGGGLGASRTSNDGRGRNAQVVDVSVSSGDVCMCVLSAATRWTRV